jgi:hypothetical protein
MSKSNTATWNREDRDLLVELRTTMSNMPLPEPSRLKISRHFILNFRDSPSVN